jgi:penicillin amidase
VVDDIGSRPAARRGVRRVLRWALAVMVLGVLLGGAGSLWLWSRLRASLPVVEGRVGVAGLSAPVTIERDALGVPTLRGDNRLDVARATGFVHAQERFFQMDLLRRTAAGELAELTGPAALEWDRRIRVHRFRTVARDAVASASPARRDLLEAYAAGVDAGVAALGAKPLEYFVLRAEPAPWKAEDTVLVALAMFITLQDERDRRESDFGLMHDLLPPALFELLTAPGTEWDAPLIGPAFETPALPDAAALDLRSRDGEGRDVAGRERFERLPAGSNSWAVSGRHTADGGAILANDMHLGLSVPNVWYRLSLAWRDESTGEPRRVTGVSLPGVPDVISGSNGHVAWGFTNSFGDWSDLVVLEVDTADPEVYLTPGGPRRLRHDVETIHVRGKADETLDVASTVWGPVIDHDHLGRPRALRWVAHDPEAVRGGLAPLESARDVSDAIRIAAGCGAPAQNFVVADADGHIGWSILGRIPRRVGFDGRLPASWADGKRRWDGWLAPEEYPRIIDPPDGRIWTANNRVVNGEMLRDIGDGGFALGARARQIRDRLLARDRFAEADMLDIQLDDRALLLERWRSLLLDLLTPQAVAGDPRRAEMRRLVEESWSGHASVDSVGFRLVRAFRQFLSDDVVQALTAPCREADPEFDPELFQREGPIWKILTQRPENLLEPPFHDWNERLLAAADETLDYYAGRGTPLAECRWGRRNTLRMRHPLSRSLSVLGSWLDMPALELPGDVAMPRVQGVTFGASERLVVSPGREERGLFHMPGGQSEHPLSPHYADGLGAWAHGEATPLLPGPTVHTLVLTPLQP